MKTRHSLLSLLLLICLLPAFGQVTESQIRQKINLNVPTNGTKQISAVKLREVLNKLTDYAARTDSLTLTKPTLSMVNAAIAVKADTATVGNLGRYVDKKTPFVTVEQFGTITEDAAANTVIFNLAIATGKNILLGRRTYKITNISLNKQKMSGAGHSNGWGPGNVAATIIQGSVTLLDNAEITNLNVEDAAGNGVQIRGYGVIVKSIGVHKCGGNGIDLSGADNLNLNHFLIDGIASTYNSGLGISIDHTGITDPNLPNINAGSVRKIDVRGNTVGGLYINRSIDNGFSDCSVELNPGYGIKLGPYAKGNHFYSLYLEANVGGDMILETGSSNNYVWSYRSGTSNDNIQDSGTNNFIFGKIYNVPRIRKVAFGNVEWMDFDEGRWQAQKTNQNLVIGATNTALPARVYVQHLGDGLGNFGTAGFGLKSGGQNAVFTDIVTRTITVAFGVSPANNTKYVDVSFPEIHNADMVLDWQPTGSYLPDGVIFWKCHFKQDGEIRFRIANITGADITVGNIEVVVKGTRTVQ
jgi:hypothetical protein